MYNILYNNYCKIKNISEKIDNTKSDKKKKNNRDHIL